MPFWKSIRFWSGISALLISVVVHFLPNISPDIIDAIDNFVMLIGALIVGDSIRRIGSDTDGNPKKRIMQ